MPPKNFARDLRLMCQGMAIVYLTQWFLGVPAEWNPDTLFLLTMGWVVLLAVLQFFLNTRGEFKLTIWGKP
jgi:hypothetical protein